MRLPREGVENFLSYGFVRMKSTRKGRELVSWVWNNKSRSRQGVPTSVFKKIQKFGALAHSAEVLEIGPGTGRFMLECMSHMAHVETYSVIEPAHLWFRHCKAMIVEIGFAAGLEELERSQFLAGETGRQFDFIHGHAVFIQTRAPETIAYFEAVGRSLRPGGFFLVDLFQLSRIEDLEYVDRPHWATYWHRSWILGLANINGLLLLADWNEHYGQVGETRYFLFQRKRDRS